LNAYNLTESVVEDALNSLPNKVIEEASVVLYRNLSKYNSTTSLGSTDLVILITFNGAMTAGDQYALECRSSYCGSGCQPKIEHPIDFKVGSECMVVNNYQDSIAQNWECSGRGECGEFGVCECYEGYTDEFCSTKTAII
jgi:hypothetical protein